MGSAKRLWCGAAIVTSLGLGTPWALAGIGGSAPALYTKAQAQQGKKLYRDSCAICHGGHLQGGAGPALTGSMFQQMAAAQDLTPKSLLGVVSQSMPKTNPGGLSADQYDDIIAYILQQNGYPAGSTKLTATESGMQSLKLAK